MKYILKSFRGALSDEEDKGLTGSFKFGKNLDIRKRVDSLSATQDLVDEGLITSASPSASPSPSSSPSPSASPSPTPSSSPSASTSHSASPSPSSSPSLSPSTTPSSSISASPSPSAGLTTVFDDLIYFFVEASDGYTYGFGNTGSIYRRDSDGFWMRVYKDPDGAIKGSAEWYSPGHTYLYFATDTLLKRKELPGLDNWNDVTTVGNLNSTDWHTMTEAGGALTIANKEFIAYVGYDESYTPETVDLIPGNIAKTIVERNGRAIIGTVRASDTSRGVNGAIDSEVPLAQVGSDGEIFYADMASSMPVTKFPGGGKVNPGGVTNLIEQVNFFEWEEGASSWLDKQAVGNLAMFGVFNADTGKNGIYTYGRKRKNHPFVLNLEYALEVDEIGAVVDVEGTTLISYQDGTDFGVKATDPDNKATWTYESLDLKTKAKRPTQITQWKMVELFFDPLPNGTSLEVFYRMDKTGNFTRAKVDDGQSSFGTANKKKAIFFVGATGDTFEIKVVGNPYGNYTPEVHRAEISFYTSK